MYMAYTFSKEMKSLIRHNVNRNKGKWMITGEHLGRAVTFPVGNQA